MANKETKYRQVYDYLTQYIAETKSGAFPAKEHTFSIAPEELEQLRAAYHKEANK